MRTASTESLCRCEDSSSWVPSTLQELRGKFLIKGKKLNKLEASFAEEAAAGDDTDMTEEEESGSDSENDQEQNGSKVSLVAETFVTLGPFTALALLLNLTLSPSSGSRRRS